MKQPVFLRVFLNGKIEYVKQFTDAQVVLGRNDDVQVSLNDESVSPIHAVIDERDSGYYLSDLGSQSGTFRNGQKIFDEALQSGDEIQIGPYKIEFFVGVPKPARPPQQSNDIKPLDKKNVPPLPVEEPVVPKTPPVVNPPPKVEVPVEAKAPVVDKAPTPVVVEAPIAKAAQSKNKTPASAGQSTSFQELNEKMRTSRGAILEVSVAWGGRILSTHHFNTRGDITIGSDASCTIVVPLLGMTRPKYTLLRLETGARVCLTPEMNGDYYKNGEHLTFSDLKRKNRMVQVGTGYEFDLLQEEMIRVGILSDVVSIYIRFVPETAAPIIGPMLDLTASESTAMLLSVVIAALFGLYMFIYSPKPEEQIKPDEPLRKATITFNAPKKKKIIEEVKMSETEPQHKKIVKVEMKKEQTTTKPNPGKAAELRRNKNNKKTAVASSTIKQGGSINTGKPAASAKSETRDVSKMGLLSTFGGKGTQKELSKAYSGTGELIGDAAKATGFSGSNETRTGDDLGGRLKNVGSGGKGSATYGISGVGTQGKGTGTFGGGTGGIGRRGRVDLNIGESEAEFSGTIDREAIRRIIRENKKLFENCYNQALRRNSDAYGKVEISWHIEERGRVTHASVKSNSVGDKEMGACLARVISGLVFIEPPADQIAAVTYPFVFAAQ